MSVSDRDSDGSQAGYGDLFQKSVFLPVISKLIIMKRNMGNIDRLTRTVIALVFIALSFNGNIGAPLSYVLLAVAGIFLLTSIVGSCPLYSLFGFSTCRTGSTKRG